MKKYLLFILTAVILVFSLTSCDTTPIQKDYHDLKLAYDEQSHYELCDCGHKEHEEAHIFSDAIHRITEPTCTTEGIDEYHCIVCKYTEQRTVPALGHKYGDWETVTDSTCISKGQSKRVCTQCGVEEFKDIDYAAHTPIAYTDVDSTCQHEGHVGGSYCSVCKEELEASTLTNIKPHNFGDWETTQAPDCIHKGQAKRVCQDCNHEEFKELDYTDHTIVPNDEVEATCTQTGLTGGAHCSICHEEITPSTVVPMKDHNYGPWTTVDEPTCTSIGSAERECTICGNKEHKTLDKLSHTIAYYDDDPSTCIHKGHTGGTYCSECNTVLEERTELELAGHKYGEWITTDEPSCTQIGHAKRECEICGNTEYKELEKLAHTPVAYTDLEANCQHEGHTGGTYCSVCNQELTPYTTISKTGHDYNNWEQTSAPTCISIGQERRECTVCGHEEFRDVDKTAHIPTPGEAKASTCIEHGQTEGSYCSFCHAELEAPEELPYSDHNYSIETITKNATINSEGVLTHTCSVCGDSYTTPIARKELTQLIWANSFKASEFKNHFVDFYYADKTLNKTYDITIIYKDNIKYVKLIDNNTSKVYEYWYNGSEIIESCVDGYRHKAFEDMPDTDMYLKWFDLTLNNGVYFASFAYDKVEFKSDNGGYYIGNGVETRNYKGNIETASIGISFSDDEKLTGFTYSSDKYDICIFEIGTAPSITIPTATHHHIVDGKCDVCNLEYYTYSQTVNNMQLSYYVNKNNKNVEFDYILLYSNQADVTFLYPTYTENGNIKKFVTQYYEGTTPYISKTVKSFTINSNQLLKITYSDNSEERLLLLNDNTAVAASKDTDYASNSYNGDVIGQTFEYVTNDYIYKYYIKSDSEIEISRYKEVCYYNINGTEITGFNRNLEKVIGYLEGHGNGKDTKHDGSKGTVYFQLNSNLSLDIWYEGFGSAYCNAFSTVTFQNITGYYINGKRDIYVYFRGDNVDYVMYYDNSNTITITKL